MPTQLHLSEAEMQLLDTQRYRYGQALIKRRIDCVYLKGKTDMSHVQIGLFAGVHPNQVGRYIKLYQEGGLASLCYTGYGTNRSKLEDYAELLVDSFTQRPALSLAEARHRIIELTGIERDVSRVEAFLKGHGFRYRKCGYIPGKADPEKQAEWLKIELEPEIEAAKTDQSVLLFIDAAHFVLSHFCCMMWSINRLFIKSGAGRNRINVLGALNAITLEVTTLINTTYINAPVIMQFLQQLRNQYPEKPITIVLDNARYQHCNAVTTFAETLQIKLLFLPPYSPNLNLIERLWKHAKKKILYGKYFDNPLKFHQAVMGFFDNLNSIKNYELKSLLTLNFQTFENSRIYAP